MFDPSIVTFDIFFDKYFEKSHFLARPAHEKEYRFGMDELNEFLNRRHLVYPFVRVFKESREINHLQYCRKTKVAHLQLDTLIHPPDLFAQLLAGATLIIQEAHSLFPHVEAGAQALSKMFDTEVQANVYITPPHSQGFAPHWDNHDVVVHQVHGDKQWTVYEPQDYLPSLPQYFKEFKHPLKSIGDPFTLSENQLLYIPRGTPHEATSTNKLSVHITYGIRSKTARDHLVDALRNSELSWLNKSGLDAKLSDHQFEELKNDLKCASTPKSAIETWERSHEQFLNGAFYIWNNERSPRRFRVNEFTVKTVSRQCLVCFKEAKYVYSSVLYDLLDHVASLETFSIEDLSHQIEEGLFKKTMVTMLHQGLISIEP